MAGVVVLLVIESHGLLIGEGIRPETARAIRELALAQPGVRHSAGSCRCTSARTAC
ncbi:MAG: hypothetical protein ABIX46_13810 [Burkholderiaceae bacterium]